MKKENLRQEMNAGGTEYPLLAGADGKIQGQTDTEQPEEETGEDKWQEEREKRRQKKKQQRRRRRRIRLLFFLVLLAALAGVFAYIRYAPSREHMDPETYFNQMLAEAGNEQGLAEDELAVLLQTQYDPRPARLSEGELYLDYEMVRENFFTRFFWDEENQVMLYTTATQTWEIPCGSKSWKAGQEERTEEHTIVLADERGMYLSASFLQQYANYEYVTDEEARHVTLRYDWGSHLMGTVTAGSAVRRQAHIKSPVLTEAEKNEDVFILEQAEDWTLVATPDGYIGYMRSNRLKDIGEKEISRDFEEEEYPSLVRDERINLVWHPTDLAGGNEILKELISEIRNVNVISPTWFSLADEAGNITSQADADYVKTAHNAGMEVWGLISNFDPDVSTTQMVSSTQARQNLIGNLIGEALSCGMDGINLDFEAITWDGSWGYVQLARELSVACRKNDLVFSVDVPVPMPFNTYYDRKELGTVADYVIVMGYDEHYAGSEAGSVASIGFEENGITGTLEDVPAEKIISGVPFYTRLWYTAVDDEGNESVWSETYGMEIISETVDTYGLVPEWNEETGQHYVGWTLNDGTFCQIWIEDEESLAIKADLVSQYNLGGIAAWALGYERASIWDVITEHALQQTESGEREPEKELAPDENTLQQTEGGE